MFRRFLFCFESQSSSLSSFFSFIKTLGHCLFCKLDFIYLLFCVRWLLLSTLIFLHINTSIFFNVIICIIICIIIFGSVITGINTDLIFYFFNWFIQKPSFFFFLVLPLKDICFTFFALLAFCCLFSWSPKTEINLSESLETTIWEKMNLTIYRSDDHAVTIKGLPLLVNQLKNLL